MKHFKFQNTNLLYSPTTALVSVIVFTFWGCGYQSRKPESLVTNSLEIKRWELDEINGQSTLVKSPTDGMGILGKPYLEIKEKLFSGIASCNQVSGKIETDGNKIKFTLNATTVMACKEPLMKQERDFIKFLEQVTRYEIKENTLSLYAENQLVFKFSGVEKKAL